MRARKRRPIDPGLKSVVQRHVDDLGLDHDLALDRQAHRLQVLLDAAQLLGHRTHDDDTGLRADHEISTRPRADQRPKRDRDLVPEIALRNHRYAARVQGGGRYGTQAERASASEVACPGVPGAAATAGAAPPCCVAPEIAPELTRTSLRPERSPIR